MSRRSHIRQIGFDQIDNNAVNYMDDSIVVHTKISELPIENGSMRINMIVLVICINGKLQVEMNTQTYTIQRNEVLVCLPNVLISNFMQSLDFRCNILCLSQRGALEQFSEHELWNEVFHLANKPVAHIGEENMRMVDLYFSMIEARLKVGQTPYYREIIVSIVKAALYELLANAEKETDYNGDGLTKRRGALFKRFIELLSETRIKPRNLSWYAEQLYVTPKYLSTVSKQVSGKTAFAWINEYVLIDIRFWLKSTDKSVKEITSLLEFPNISFFSKYCRIHLGKSPTELRKQLREHPDGD